MIKILILAHLSSLAIAVAAWGLQHSRETRLATCFPTPKIWLSLIALALLPALVTLFPLDLTVKSQVAEVFPVLENVEHVSNSVDAIPLPYMLFAYTLCAALLVARTLILWARLQALRLTRTHEADVYSTTKDIPPLTLSWPRRLIVIPNSLTSEETLIEHERAHLRHHDAEITLGLLLLSDIMLRNPGFVYLVNHWRLATELRADYEATYLLPMPEKRAYANLLLNAHRRGEKPKGGRALPCPTAYLTSTRHRSVKMRLNEIIQVKPRPCKRRWSAALLASAVCATTLGLMNTSAAAKDNGLAVKADTITFVKRVPPIMPKTCKGLDLNPIKIERKNFTVQGQNTRQMGATVGSVLLKFDIRPNGKPHNIRVVESNAHCFDAPAKTSVAQWITEPQTRAVREESVRITFYMTGESREELETSLRDFAQ